MMVRLSLPMSKFLAFGVDAELDLMCLYVETQDVPAGLVARVVVKDLTVANPGEAGGDVIIAAWDARERVVGSADLKVDFAGKPLVGP